MVHQLLALLSSAWEAEDQPWRQTVELRHKTTGNRIVVSRAALVNLHLFQRGSLDGPEVAMLAQKIEKAGADQAHKDTLFTIEITKNLVGEDAFKGPFSYDFDVVWLGPAV